MQTFTNRKFKLVHPEHLRAADPFGQQLTQDQRLSQAKQDRRVADEGNLIERRKQEQDRRALEGADLLARLRRIDDRRFTGRSLTGFGLSAFGAL